MSKSNTYKPGNPEYDFWNDKNLYPDLKNDADYAAQPASQSGNQPYPENHKTGFGTVFLIACLWLLFLAPFALFFTWEDGIVQAIFWGGLTLILITWALALYNACRDYKRKK